ncbi:tautomerase family protein [Kaistia terrae]|uniref:4-oxalocrotonate tautomerase family protein n=1 Tax=Kaistia terrae TaxID=537017 RepID=A0ABW0Q5E8_9HYPH|nr:tautomerase family protein [Kaistia terrae]MCX5581711.1 tautomerase family protein [Kaistia terrae]
MPIMDVRYGSGALDERSKADLAKRLTDVLLHMEGGAGTPAGRAFAWVLLTEIPAADWWIAGDTQQVGASVLGRFLVRVTVPEGYMNVEHKSEVHALVNEAIIAATGVSGPDAGKTTLVMIDEVPEGNWGWDGKTISLENIADSVGLSKSGPRFKWSEKYFAAKARERAAAGYPIDTAGLLPSQRPDGV